MFSKLTMTFMAGAFALASAVTPTEVRAGNDAGKVIAGIAVGAIIGAAIASNTKKRKHQGGHVSRGHQDVYGGGYERVHSGGHNRGHNKGYKGHDGYGQRSVNLPGACRIYNGHRSGYSGRCLGRYNYTYAALPSACAVRVGGHHGTIYRDRCLNQYGYH